MTKGRERGSVGHGERERERWHRGEKVCTFGCTVIEKEKEKEKERASMLGGEKREIWQKGERDSMLGREKK